MAMVEFPSSVAGREAYRRLREFRRLHEHAYPLDIITVKEGDNAGSLMPTKQRGKVLMNQKANTVADLAAVLIQLERDPDDRRIQAKEISASFWKARRKQRPEKFKRLPLPAVELAGVKGVRIRWADPFDAEYAREWPRAVVHHQLVQARHSPAFPELSPHGAGQDFSEEGDDSISLLPHKPKLDPIDRLKSKLNSTQAQKSKLDPIYRLKSKLYSIQAQKSKLDSTDTLTAAEKVPIGRKQMLFPKAKETEERVRPRPKPTHGFRGQPFKAKVPRSKVKLGSEAKRGRERVGAVSWLERR